MRIVLVIGSLLGFATAALGIATMRSDIQLTIAVVGLFAGFGLLGLSAIVQRSDQTWHLLKQWEAERE